MSPMPGIRPTMPSSPKRIEVPGIGTQESSRRLEQVRDFRREKGHPARRCRECGGRIFRVRAVCRCRWWPWFGLLGLF